MINRTTDVLAITEATNPYRNKLVGFNPLMWSADEKNIALVDEDNNLILLEYVHDGVYTGHYFLKERGHKAVILCEQFLEYIFEECGIKIVQGLTPLQNLGARWMNNKLGFEKHGVVDTVNGPHLLVMMTEEQYRSKYKDE